LVGRPVPSRRAEQQALRSAASIVPGVTLRRSLTASGSTSEASASRLLAEWLYLRPVVARVTAPETDRSIGQERGQSVENRYAQSLLEMVPDDSVFVPGHTGDFLAGSHMIAHRRWVRAGRAEDMLRAIRHEHYHSFREASPPGRDLWPEASAKILSCSGDLVDGTSESVLDACDSWAWQERQAKYIVNSVRVYDC
jgi:hypothetical protein